MNEMSSILSQHNQINDFMFVVFSFVFSSPFFFFSSILLLLLFVYVAICLHHVAAVAALSAAVAAADAATADDNTTDYRVFVLAIVSKSSHTNRLVIHRHRSHRHVNRCPAFITTHRCYHQAKAYCTRIPYVQHRIIRQLTSNAMENVDPGT